MNARWLHGLLLLFWVGMSSCDSQHEITISEKMMVEQLELMADVQQIYDVKKQDIKGFFVRQYRNSRPFVSFSPDYISLPDTSDFRGYYLELKTFTFSGLALFNQLDAIENQLRDLHLTDYHTSPRNVQNQEVVQLAADIEAYVSQFGFIPKEYPKMSQTIDQNLELIRMEATPLLQHLSAMEALKLSLIRLIAEIQRRYYHGNIHDYFTQLSPFLLIPEAEQFYVDAQATHVNYSGRIYAINRYDFSQGLFIQSVTANGKDIGYSPDNPQYRFTLPVVKNSGDSMKIRLEATAITHEGVDTTFVVERKLKVCP